VINVDFKSVEEIENAFPDELSCILHLESLRWNGNVISPFDVNSKIYICSGNRYRCKNTGMYFNVRTGTIFDNSKLPLKTWFVAIFIATILEQGISSIQLAKELNVTQKTAWLILQRINLVLKK
jgi:hypothetical protein